MQTRQQPRCYCLRWSFRINSWQPSQEEWNKALGSVQVEEVSRINKFVFREDAKAALIGRLLLRCGIGNCLQIPWRDITLIRTDKGKPILANCQFTNFGYNVSHQGDFAVLATSCSPNCGVDVMKIENRSKQTVSQYINSLKRQFSDRELSSFDKFNDDHSKLTLFYRYWCLKESIVKAQGTGIHSDLSKLDFCIKSWGLGENHVTTDTSVNLDADAYPANNKVWKFEETLVDSNHVAAVCYDIGFGKSDVCSNASGLLFEEKSIDFLLQNSQPLHSISDQEFDVFQKKLSKTF